MRSWTPAHRTLTRRAHAGLQRVLDNVSADPAIATQTSLSQVEIASLVLELHRNVAGTFHTRFRSQGMTGVATDRNIRNNRRRDTAKCLQRLRELPRPRSRARVLHGHTRHPRTAPAGRAPP